MEGRAPLYALETETEPYTGCTKSRRTRALEPEWRWGCPPESSPSSEQAACSGQLVPFPAYRPAHRLFLKPETSASKALVTPAPCSSCLLSRQGLWRLLSITCAPLPGGLVGGEQPIVHHQ